MYSKAIVSYPSTDGKSVTWKLQNVEVREDLMPDEVLVEMVSVGLCHTDLVVSVGQSEGARILGHEGAGYVKKIGDKITHCKVGDPVLLSYSYCSTCSSCKTGHESYCEKFAPLNMVPCESVGETFSVADGLKATGKFFGQSSFSKFSVVRESLVVNVKEFNLSNDQLKKLGPLGCGFQTGAGAIINSGAAKEGESVAIYGLGGVGMAAVMAAKIAGCRTIIAVDLLDSKIEIAKRLGATHGVKAGNPEEVKRQLTEITGNGPDLSFECVGGPKFVETAIENAGIKGRIVYVGVGDSIECLQVPSFPFMLAGKQLIGSIEGDAKPSEFVPKMIQWYLDGNFPINEIETVYPVEKFADALADMKAGKIIKPILEF